MRNRADIEKTMELHADTVMRACALYFNNQADRDDAFQDTFIKYAQSDKEFEDEEHRKAWLIRVATNTCKDMLKAARMSNLPLEESHEQIPDRANVEDQVEREELAEELAKALRGLDEQYRTVLYLKYYEGYTASEIGKMLNIAENTVYTRVMRGKEKLKEVLSHG